MNHKGFYLLEAMLMMLIVSSFLLIIPSVRRSSCKSEIKYFVELINSDIQYGISYSITHSSLINIYLLSDRNQYLIYDGSLKAIRKYNYSNNLHINDIRIYITHGYVIDTNYLTITCENQVSKFRITKISGLIYEI